jgi:hypothetical protein
MPCPPSWEELETMRHERGVDLATHSFDERWPLMARSVALVESLGGRAPLDDAEHELETTLEHARAFLSAGRPIRPVTAYSGYPSMEDVEAFGREVDRFETNARAVDLACCVLGTIVVRFLRAHGPLASGDPLAAECELVERLHREHRLAERAALIERTTSELARARSYPPLRGEYEHAVERRLAALQAIDDETLFRMRKCLGS